MTTCPQCGHTWKQDARSLPQHNRFFKVIDVAFHHWPEDADFQPESAEHLRAWLLIRAGHKKVTTVPFEFDDPRIRNLALLAVEQAMSAAGAHAFVRPHGNAIAVFAAKSIKHKLVGHKAFQPIAMAVDEIVESVIGVPTDDLLKQHERAA